MSHRSRGSGFSVVTWIFCFVVACLAIAGAYNAGRSKGIAVGENITNSDTYATHAQQDIESRCLISDPASSAECIRNVIEATNEHQRAEDDLVAQTDMALWAFGMLIVTASMAAITAVGVVFIWHTLTATQEMAKDAARATDAAVRSVDIAGEMGRAQARAYMSYS